MINPTPVTPATDEEIAGHLCGGAGGGCEDWPDCDICRLIARIESEKAQNDYQYEAGFNAALEAIASCDVVTVEEVRSRYGL